MSQPRPHISFSPTGGVAILPAVNVHKITSNYSTNRNVLINRFNCYGFQTTSYAQTKHKVTNFAAVPFAVAAQSCTWTNKRVGQTFNSEITLTGMMLNADQCVDEVFGSDMEAILLPARNGYTALGQQIMADFAMAVAENFSDDVLGAATAGNMITDFSASTFDERYDTAFKTNLVTASGLYTGWLKQAITTALSAGYGHMNLALLNTSTDLINNGAGIDSQKAVEALIALKAQAPAQLRQALLGTRVLRNGQPLNAFYLVSQSYIDAANAWLDKKMNTNSDNNSAVTRTVENGVIVTRVNGLPLVYDPKIEHYTNYLSNTHAHVAVLTTSENINYVMGLKGVWNPEDQAINGALSINTPVNVGEWTGKKMFMSADAKIGGGIANADLFCGTIQTVVNS